MRHGVWSVDSGDDEQQVYAVLLQEHRYKSELLLLLESTGAM